MANRLETVKNYLGSVADRAVAFTYWKAVYRQDIKKEKVPNIDMINEANETLFSAFGATFPTGTGLLKRAFYSENPKMRKFLIVASGTALLLDFAIMANSADAAFPAADLATRFSFPILGDRPLTNIIHNPVEAIAFKIGVNAVTHITFDAVGAGLNIANTAINRIKHLRPPTAPISTI